MAEERKFTDQELARRAKLDKYRELGVDRIMYRTQPYLYEKDVIKPWALLSFRFTKEIGRVAELSVIANNFTNTKKWHTNPHSLAKTQLYPDMYFGAELKLKL